MNNSANNQLSCPISLLKDNYRLFNKPTKRLPECGNGSIPGNSNFFKSTPPPSKYFYHRIFKILHIVSEKPDKTPRQGLNLITFSSKSSNILQTLKTCCFVFHSENPNNKALQTRALFKIIEWFCLAKPRENTNKSAKNTKKCSFFLKKCRKISTPRKSRQKVK